jgi:protoporphyrin/coproporphyrin ferrochelatase
MSGGYATSFAGGATDSPTDRREAMNTAVVLFNLGGPDRPEAVRPFLFNLFNDPAIITVPTPMRYLLAQWISRRRTGTAQKIYRLLGGGSPLLANTEAQARALERALGDNFRVFIAMRYWHPRSEETARVVKAYAPDQIILLPLYPQFSSTTTGSSRAAWARAAASSGLHVPTRTICCYPMESGFIAALADATREAYGEAVKVGRPRVLFTAHGLPKKIVERGDPYQWQVEQSAVAIVRDLRIEGLDWSVCYQSRVGRLEWIGPYTESEIERGGRDRVPIVLVPIAFVSEHSETLVELDITYRELAAKHGVPAFFRVPTVATNDVFITGLAERIRTAMAWPVGACETATSGRLCPGSWSRCAATVARS